MVTQEQLNKWVEEQFAVEASGELVINSIAKKEDSKDTQHYVSVFESYIFKDSDFGQKKMET